MLGLLGDRTLKVAQAVVTGGLLGPASLGFLRYGERIARMPVNAMVAIGSNSLFPAFARIAGQPDRMRVAFLRALGLVITGGCLVAAGLAAVGVPLVVVVLGQDWREAGVVLVSMSGMAVGKSVATVSEEAIKGAGRTGLLNRVTVLELVLGLGLLVLLAGPYGLVGVGLAISGTAIGAGLALLWLARSVVGVRWRQVGGVTVPALVSGAVAAAVVWPLEHLVLQADSRGVWLGLAMLVLDGVVLLTVYLGILVLIAPSSLSDALSMMRAATRRSHRGSRSATGPAPAEDPGS